MGVRLTLVGSDSTEEHCATSGGKGSSSETDSLDIHGFQNTSLSLKIQPDIPSKTQTTP